MNYIGVGRRAVAIILDTLVFFVLAIPASMLWGENYAERTEAGFQAEFSISGAAFFIPAGIWILYFIVMEATVGATLGKLALGLRVRKEDGSKISWGESLVRNLLRIIDGIFFYLVGAIIIWNSPKKQRLGDHAAKTIVLEKNDVGIVGEVPVDQGAEHAFHVPDGSTPPAPPEMPSGPTA